MRKVLQLSQTCLLSIFCGSFGWGTEGEWKGEGPLVARFLLATDGLESGMEFWLGWQIRRDQGWHTYWEHPGDVGVPPVMDLVLPAGFKMEPWIMPPPERVWMGEIGANGHRGDTIFLSKITAPSLSLGSLIEIKGRASWLACSDVCLPEQVELEIAVPVVSESVAVPYWEKVFQTELKRQPIALEDSGGFSVMEAGKFYKLLFPSRLAGASGSVDFFARDRITRSQKKPVCRRSAKSSELLLEKSPWGPRNPQSLSGLLLADGNEGRPVYNEVNLPIIR